MFVRFQRLGDLFTCDVGVVSALLLAECGPFPPEHWAIRLGPIAVGHDKWWDLTDGDVAIAADFLPALARGLNHVAPFATDEGLRDELLKDVTMDGRGLAPIEAEWLTAFNKTIGVPDWAIGIPIRVRGGSVLHLRARTEI